MKWIRNWFYQKYWSFIQRPSDRLMSRCRVCGSSEDVIGYDPRGIWAYPFRKTWCPDHCPEHDFNRHRDGIYCDNCSIGPPEDWYDHG